MRSFRASSIRQGSEIRKRRSSVTRRLSSPAPESKEPQKGRMSNIDLTNSLMSLRSTDSVSSRYKVEKTKISARRMRIDVLRALAFKHAHKLAETKLKLYVNRFYDDEDESMQEKHDLTHKILQRVLDESLDQIALADEMLEKEVDDRDIEIILSHYCAKILIRRLRKFTELKVAEGLIGKKQGRDYLKMMKDKMQHIDQRTVEELAESERNMPEQNLHPQKAIGKSAKRNETSLMQFLNSDDLENADDTIGRSNTKARHARNSTEPSFGNALDDLFRMPSGMDGNSDRESMPHIEEGNEQEEGDQVKSDAITDENDNDRDSAEC